MDSENHSLHGHPSHVNSGIVQAHHYLAGDGDIDLLCGVLCRARSNDSCGGYLGAQCCLGVVRVLDTRRETVQRRYKQWFHEYERAGGKSLKADKAVVSRDQLRFFFGA